MSITTKTTKTELSTRLDLIKALADSLIFNLRYITDHRKTSLLDMAKDIKELTE